MMITWVTTCLIGRIIVFISGHGMGVVAVWARRLGAEIKGAAIRMGSDQIYNYVINSSKSNKSTIRNQSVIQKQISSLMGPKRLLSKIKMRGLSIEPDFTKEFFSEQGKNRKERRKSTNSLVIYRGNCMSCEREFLGFFLDCKLEKINGRKYIFFHCMQAEYCRGHYAVLISSGKKHGFLYSTSLCMAFEYMQLSAAHKSHTLMNGTYVKKQKREREPLNAGRKYVSNPARREQEQPGNRQPLGLTRKLPQTSDEGEEKRTDVLCMLRCLSGAQRLGKKYLVKNRRCDYREGSKFRGWTAKRSKTGQLVRRKGWKKKGEISIKTKRVGWNGSTKKNRIFFSFFFVDDDDVVVVVFTQVTKKREKKKRNKSGEQNFQHYTIFFGFILCFISKKNHPNKSELIHEH
ncbi:hypothetical protein VP01_1427g2 [Puccinia sorghi]|uniref:Uncharacterized protein n=1 Tax=Puccinia sorghi TaxID=27349 RepID=A0A0L6VKP3_9BASI|nr:hypothetical protein VP01_1427g2 [Puccinia sorghi]